MAPSVAQSLLAVQDTLKLKQQELLTPAELSNAARRLKNRKSLGPKTRREVVDLAYSSLVYQKAYRMLLEQIAITYGGRFAITYDAQIIAKVQTELDRNF